MSIVHSFTDTENRIVAEARRYEGNDPVLGQLAIRIPNMYDRIISGALKGQQFVDVLAQLRDFIDQWEEYE